MLTIDTIFVLLLATSSIQEAANPAHEAAAQLSNELRKSNSVSIYYVSRTGEYSYSPQQIRGKSSLLIKRQCGSDCSHLMNPIVQHLQEAVPSNCQKGQQSVLVEVDGQPSLVYSHGGRSVQYKGKCYFNKNNVRNSIKTSEIIPP
jgi:hypothetical protein